MAAIQGDDGTPSGFHPGRPFGVWGDSGDTAGGNGAVGSSESSSGVVGFTQRASADAAGVFGMGPYVGVAGWLTGTAGPFPAERVAVYGSGSNGANLGGVGVHGVSDVNAGVLGQSGAGVGVRGESGNAAVVGRLTGASGALPAERVAVFGSASNGASLGGVGVHGVSDVNVAVLGQSGTGDGVRGESGNFGVVGNGANAGVAAFNPNNANAAYLASDRCAAWFTGPVHVAGALSRTGGGFRIDHPQRPAEAFLSHSHVESSERKNLYDGVVVAGADGRSVVELPDWFVALNTDFRYQLTAIGAPAPDLHVAEQIRDNRFTIAGAPAGATVSWLVTGVRRDRWARANPVAVEEAKPYRERGRYLHPELYGGAPAQGITRARHPL